MAEVRMTFLDHLEEFRRRLVVAVIAFVIAAIIGFNYSWEILAFLKQRLPAITLNYKAVMDPFMVRFKLGLLAGFFLAFPVIAYEVIAFLAPALKKKERRLLYPMAAMLVVLFAAGAALGYYFIMPIGVKWLLAQDGGHLVRLLEVNYFIDFVTLFILAFGTAFETPIVLIILIKLGVVSRASLRKNWRISYVTLLVISAIATPDWSLPPMLMLGSAMIILYELTLLVVRWI